MWTPRRIGLLLLGFFAFVASYAVYAQMLGWLDGLPQLPQSKLPSPDQRDSPRPPPKPDVSPTELRIIEAFGPNAAERSSVYATKLEFRNGETSVVLAAGPFPLEPGATKVSLVPFSMAVFGKPKPVHLRQPGETVEINTFHADKAILEYDRPITTAQDMSKAKLKRMELVSDPEDALPDPRRGKVHITNNQSSLDPNHMLVMRTPGPVFYRDSKALEKPDHGPDIWTDAPVELVDRRNLPRPFGRPSPLTAAEPRGSDFRSSRVLADILTGRRLPPPTLTGVGMKIFFEPEHPAAAPPTNVKRPQAGAMRRIELAEKVLINLWVDSSTSFTSEPMKTGPSNPSSNPLNAPMPPEAASAAIGGVVDGTQTMRLLDKALLQIETRGPFAYDAATNTARFDVIPQANPNIPNDVQVSRILARGGQHNLFSQVLEIEFVGSPTSGVSAPPPESTTGANLPAAAGPSFKRLHAWTSTPGRFLTLTMSSADNSAQPQPTLGVLERTPTEQDQLVAFGEDLVYDQPTDRSILIGSPLYVLRDRNVLTAGDPKPKRPGKLVMEPAPAEKGAEKKMTATVHGPGRIELYDSATKSNNLHAIWQTSLTHEKETVNGREVDRLTFTDGAVFEDKQADYWLQGNVLKLWMGGDKAANATPAEGNKQPLPQRIQALGDVKAHSREADIEQADQLNVLFQDAPPDAAVASAAAGNSGTPAPPAGGTPASPTAPGAAATPAPQEKPKPPLKLTARLVDSFVLRTPQLPTANASGGAVRYDLKTVRCEDRVVVHQEPTEPNKARGLDIFGQTLDLKHSRLGSEMTVTGPDEKPGEVHYEDLSIIGPKVFIDQIHNLTRVTGRGVLQMPSSSDLSGNELRQPEDVRVFWRDGMTFTGAMKSAEFQGKVVALQGESWVTCHRMEVGFDRPIYFNQMKKTRTEPTATNTPGKDGPKIRTVKCYPAPGDAVVEGPKSTHVFFNEILRDPVTKAITKTQLVQAEDLTLDAKGLPRQPQNNVFANGRGVVRMWQPGQKDWAASGEEKKPATTPATTETEMKLTIVEYGGRMTVVDKKVFQEAVFSDNIQVIHLPTDDPNAKVELHRLPPGSVLLTCNETLTATTYRPADGPVKQGMAARGNAYIRTDEYEGWGEQIDYDGRLIVLKGSKAAPARIMSRFKGTENSGREIKLDRMTNSYELVDGVSGQFGSPKK